MPQNESPVKAAWHLTSSLDEMIAAMEEAVVVAHSTYNDALLNSRPHSLVQERMRMWRVRADVLNLLLTLREVDPIQLPASFPAVMNAVTETMLFTRKTIREYKELAREKAALEEVLHETVRKYNDMVDQVNSARLSAMIAHGVSTR